MALSSNTLTHFTKDLNSLQGILKDTFKVKYCREILRSSKGHFDILVPVVSFCDIPFSQVLNHINSYGNYGIGLSKDWARRNGLNPVLYVDRDSKIANSFYSSFFKMVMNRTNKITDFTIEERRTFDIIRYMKNYQADLIRENRPPIKDYRFSDEREWRYVLHPEENKVGIFYNCKGKTIAEIKKIKWAANFLIEDKSLSFGPDDINYIIINKEDERDAILDALPELKNGHDQRVIKRLSSRIISVDQIRGDF